MKRIKLSIVIIVEAFACLFMGYIVGSHKTWGIVKQILQELQNEIYRKKD